MPAQESHERREESPQPIRLFRGRLGAVSPPDAVSGAAFANLHQITEMRDGDDRLLDLLHTNKLRRIVEEVDVVNSPMDVIHLRRAENDQDSLFLALGKIHPCPHEEPGKTVVDIRHSRAAELESEREVPVRRLDALLLRKSRQRGD